MARSPMSPNSEPRQITQPKMKLGMTRAWLGCPYAWSSSSCGLSCGSSTAIWKHLSGRATFQVVLGGGPRVGPVTPPAIVMCGFSGSQAECRRFDPDRPLHLLQGLRVRIAHWDESVGQQNELDRLSLQNTVVQCLYEALMKLAAQRLIFLREGEFGNAHVQR